MTREFCVFVLLGSLLTLVPSSAATFAAETAAWKAGVATVVITPDEPMWMAGYAARNKPSEGKVHELYAKALIQAGIFIDFINRTTDLSEAGGYDKQRGCDLPSKYSCYVSKTWMHSITSYREGSKISSEEYVLPSCS